MENFVDVINWMQHMDPHGEYLELLSEEIPNETIDGLIEDIKIWRDDSYENGKLVHTNQWYTCEKARMILETYRLSRWADIIRKEEKHV